MRAPMTVPESRFLPTDQSVERMQRERLAVLALAAASYTLDGVWIASFVPSGVVDGGDALRYLAIAWAACGAFGVAFWRGWNLRSTDANLTVWQVAFGYALQLGFLATVPAIGPLFLGAMIIIAAFAAIAMSTRQFAWTWALVSVAAGGVMWRNGAQIRLPVATATDRWLVWAIASSILGRVMFVNARVMRLRQLLAREHARLRASHRDLKRESAERQRAERALQAAQRMESIGRLAGGVAHDLNNQLTVVIGHAALLRARLQDADDRADIERITAAASKSARLTTELLTFARRRPARPVHLDLNATLTESTSMLSHLMESGIAVELKLQRPLWHVWVDRAQVELLLVNLCVNASDAMPHGGTLTLETAGVTLDAEQVRAYEGLEAGDFVRLTVRDTGVGIPERLLGQIFEPFFTTKEFGRGTGLGLSACYGVARQFGGHIGVTSVEGAGTSFEILLPRSQGSVTETTEARPLDDLPRGTGEVILVVDDMPEARFVLVRMLESAGYRVEEAINGEEALAELEVRGVAVDLVLTDVVMPVMNGRALSENLARWQPSLPVILMSAYPESLLTREGMLDVTRPFVSKPIAPDVLLPAIARALAISPARALAGGAASAPTGERRSAPSPATGPAP